MVNNPTEGYFHYNLSGLLTLGTAVASLAVGFFVLHKEWKSRLHQSFFLITATGSLWLISIGMVQLVRVEDSAYFWVALNYALAVPYISPSVYLFSIFWRGDFKRLPIARAGFLIALLFGLIPILFARDIFFFAPVPGTRFDQFSRTIPGTGYFLIICSLFSVYAILAFVNFIKAWQLADSPSRRAQCRIFLCAAGIGYTGSIDFFVALGLQCYPFGYISFFVFTVLVAYAVARHRFLNVNIFIRRFSLILLIYTVLLSVILPFAIPTLNHLYSFSSPSAIWQLVGISAAIGIGISLGPLIYVNLVRRNVWLRGHLATGFTHELKTPLYAIQGALDAIRSRGPGTLDADYLTMIESNVSRLDLLVHDLLQIVHIQEGTVSLDKSSFELQQMIDGEVRVHAKAAALKLVTIHFNVGHPQLIEGDKEKIRQVISNVMSNAVKFSHPGGRIFVTLEDHDGWLICTIKDEGRGIPPHLLERIFDRFFTGSNSSRGAGVGLAIAKGWIDLHGGRIWAESKGEGTGTAVIFTLPTFSRELDRVGTLQREIK